MLFGIDDITGRFSDATLAALTDSIVYMAPLVDRAEGRGHIRLAPISCYPSAVKCTTCHRLYTPDSLAPFLSRGDMNRLISMPLCETRGEALARMGDLLGDQICYECTLGVVSYCSEHHRAGHCIDCHGGLESVEDIMSMGLNRTGRGALGEPTLRFPRHVGLEIETGPWHLHARNPETNMDLAQSARCLGFALEIHQDGSLDRGDGGGSFHGWEIVTRPIRGREVLRHAKFIYQSARDYGFSIENILAGAHVHVDARDLYCTLGRDQSDVNFKLFDSYFNTCIDICRMFISSRRRNNSYCRERFGIRDESLTFIRRGGERVFRGQMYCGIAIRRKTLEFRMWPSSNSLANHMARIELSCKMVHTLASTPTAEWPRLVADLAAAFTGSTINVGKLTRVLRLSRTTRETLSKIAARYDTRPRVSPTPGDIMSLEIPDPEEFSRLVNKLANDEAYSDFRRGSPAACRAWAESVLSNPHVTRGDTLIYVPGVGKYLDAETLECVPAGTDPYRYRI